MVLSSFLHLGAPDPTLVYAMVHAVLHPAVCLRDVVLFLGSGRTTVFGTVNAVVLYLRNFTYLYIYVIYMCMEVLVNTMHRC